MNDDLITRFGVPSWPTWVKLLVGLLLAVIVPLGLVLLLAISSIQSISVQNVQLFLAESAGYHAKEISEIFVTAQHEMDDYLDDPTRVANMLHVLPGSSAAAADPLDRAALINNLQDTMLNKSNPSFEYVNLLDADGQLVLHAAPGRRALINSGEDYSSTEAYRRGVEVNMSGEDRTLSIDLGEDNTPLLDVVRVLTDPDDDSIVFGFLIGRMTADVAEREILEFNLDFLNIHSYLITTRGLVIDEAGVHEAETSLLTIDSLQRLELDDSFLETVTENGQDVVRYYAEIPESPFIFISEGMVEPVANQIFAFFAQRSFALVIGVFALIAVLVLLGNQLIVPPLRRITQAIQAMAAGDYSASVPDIQRGDELGELAGTFADMRKQVLTLVTDLEERIEVRVRDVTATREISHAAATQRDLQALIDQVVNLLVERFDNIYHAQIFLIDSDEINASLRASTGEMGRTLMSRGHRLRVGSPGVVGRASESGAMTLSHNRVTGAGRPQSEHLPDTRSELAIPLRVGERIIGVLDVHSKLNSAFNTEQMEVLQAMADQVALAIENARLYSESLRRLNEIEAAQQRSTMEAWHHYLRGLRARHLESAVGVLPGSGHQGRSQALREEALAEGRVVVGELTDRETIPLVVPIRLRGQLLGTVEWEVPQDEFDLNKVQLAQNLTEQLAVNLENARLFQESQRATQRERLVNEISSRLTSQNDIDQILQTAVREVGMALRSPQVSVRLSQSAQTNGHTAAEVEDKTESRSESI